MTIFRDQCKFYLFIITQGGYKNSEGQLSQRASRVNQNLEEASKERGTLYVLRKLQISVPQWIQEFFGYLKLHLLKQYVSAKNPKD